MAAWGERLGAGAARWAGFVTLRGPLGAGKTALVRAACRGAGVREAVTSPTYALVHRYRADGTFVHHVDLYRLEEPAELVELGWEELLAADGPVFVEWPERAAGWLPADRWDVRLSLDPDPLLRIAEAEARGGAPPVPGPAPAPVGSGAAR
jgi:tRNA threonylcarbamoyladenosine biosynthesis protein TsaE